MDSGIQNQLTNKWFQDPGGNPKGKAEHLPVVGPRTPAAGPACMHFPLTSSTPLGPADWVWADFSSPGTLGLMILCRKIQQQKLSRREKQGPGAVCPQSCPHVAPLPRTPSSGASRPVPCTATAHSSPGRTSLCLQVVLAQIALSLCGKTMCLKSHSFPQDKAGGLEPHDHNTRDHA